MENNIVNQHDHFRSHEFVFIYDSGVCRCTSIHDIIYAEARRNYCNVYIAGRKNPIVLSITLKSLFADINPIYFRRIHRSFIVNIEHIEYTTSGSVKLRDGKILPIGRDYKESFKNSITILGAQSRFCDRKD